MRSGSEDNRSLPNVPSDAVEPNAYQNEVLRELGVPVPQ